MSAVAVEQTAQSSFDQLVNETMATWPQFQLDRSAFVRHLQALNVVSAENGGTNKRAFRTCTLHLLAFPATAPPWSCLPASTWTAFRSSCVA
jgi:hypothetical protein